jgi:hypothetical protein
MRGLVPRIQVFPAAAGILVEHLFGLLWMMWRNEIATVTIVFDWKIERVHKRQCVTFLLG